MKINFESPYTRRRVGVAESDSDLVEALRKQVYVPEVVEVDHRLYNSSERHFLIINLNSSRAGLLGHNSIPRLSLVVNRLLRPLGAGYSFDTGERGSPLLDGC
jgi:hypothetical protein